MQRTSADIEEFLADLEELKARIQEARAKFNVRTASCLDEDMVDAGFANMLNASNSMKNHATKLHESAVLGEAVKKTKDRALNDALAIGSGNTPPSSNLLAAE